ncbi:uncharacterized protein EI90DRAFT_3068694, partial [Cantharellus anzutake]|uniref:uncharacterized protein n=1 Tax=Cantharellus anzutake TaxID=1750568 RepID=UPI00190421F0
MPSRKSCPAPSPKSYVPPSISSGKSPSAPDHWRELYPFFFFVFPLSEYPVLEMSVRDA